MNDVATVWKRFGLRRGDGDDEEGERRSVGEGNNIGNNNVRIKRRKR